MFEVISRRQISFSALEDIHQEVIHKVEEHKGSYLILSEPLPTLTQGRSGSDADLLVSQEFLLQNGISTYPVSRGGKWTYHGPGQLVGYPIVHLPSLGYDSKAVQPFLRILRNTIGDVIESYGLKVEYQDKPYGIYVENRKLVSFGIQIRNGVTSHGFALYLTDQRPAFKLIHPCGVPGHKPTSLEEHGINISWEDCASSIARGLNAAYATRRSLGGGCSGSL